MPKVEFTEQERKEQKAKVEKTKKKSGRPFKVESHVNHHEVLQNSIFKHLSGDDTNLTDRRHENGPSDDWILENLIWFLRERRFIPKDGSYPGSAISFRWSQILNEIKILANEGKIELGKHKILKKRTVKLAQGFAWCSGCNEYEWHELQALYGC